ncbi:MAG: hypothetical protein LJE70_15980, partial [Chromatiaceae bacterium]|nr:hypothetical protein [Chromatiaceae bacterium]
GFRRRALCKELITGQVDPQARDQQFRHIAALRRLARQRGIPVLSIDTKKKEPHGTLLGIRYLANYVNEAALREDTRRLSNGEIFRDILTKCTRTHAHRDWCGYWQGNKRLEERLAA